MEKYDIRNCDNRKGEVQRGMDIAEIKERMRARGLKQVDLARVLDLDPIKISKALRGERQFKVSEMDRIRDWLAETKSTDMGFARPIPIIGQVAAGNWREAVAQSSASIPSPDPSISRNAFALRVTGDSMDQYVEDGGTVIVDPDDRTLFSGRFYVVLNEEGETTFKRFAADPARLVPCSSNPTHREIEIGSDSFTIVGRVIWRAARM